MPITEGEIRAAIKAIVETYGSLSTTEMIKILRETIEPDEYDTQINLSRNDDKFSQKVRNVVSHSPEGEIVDKDGFIIDKTQKPAMFRAKSKITVLKSTKLQKDEFDNVVLSDSEVETRKRRNSNYIARKIDFDKLYEESKRLGAAGEEYAIIWEQNRLRKLGIAEEIVKNEVIHISKFEGDGSGYDILSIKDNDKAPLYIEVKTTKGSSDTQFMMSNNEKAFMEEYHEDVVIYRVYNFDDTTNSGEVIVLTHDYLEKNYNFNPAVYRVSKK